MLAKPEKVKWRPQVDDDVSSLIIFEYFNISIFQFNDDISLLKSRRKITDNIIKRKVLAIGIVYYLIVVYLRILVF